MNQLHEDFQDFINSLRTLKYWYLVLVVALVIYIDQLFHPHLDLHQVQEYYYDSYLLHYTLFEPSQNSHTNF